MPTTKKRVSKKKRVSQKNQCGGVIYAVEYMKFYDNHPDIGFYIVVKKNE